MKTLYRLIFSLNALVMSLTAGAQVLPFVTADYDPAAFAKGGAAYADFSSAAYAAFSSPAASVFYDGSMDVAAGFTMWQPSAVQTKVMNVAGTYKIEDKFGISAGLSYGMNNAYDIIDAIGNTTGSFTPSQMHFGAGFAWRFIDNVSLGVNIGYASSSLAESTLYGTVVADIQAMAVFGNLRASAGVSDLGGGITSASGAKFGLPSAARVGVGYELVAAEKHIVDFCADASYYFKNGIAAAAGLSYTFSDLLSVRTGYRYGGNTAIPSFASVGMGIRMFGIKIDVGYAVTGSAMANTLCASVGYTF